VQTITLHYIFMCKMIAYSLIECQLGSEKGKMTKETLGQMIFRLRTEKKIGVRELGRKVEVSGVHISSIEKDKATPSPELLRKIAGALDVDGDRLMVRADQVDPEVLKVIKGNSYAVHDFLRTAKGLKKDQWEELKKEAQKMIDKNK